LKLKPVEIPVRPRGLRVEALAVTDPRLVIDAQAGSVDLFDSITPDTPTQIAAALRQMSGRPVTLRLNSLGGDPFSAMAGFNMLVGYPGNVAVEVLGAAMSAASLLAMAGDEIGIAASAMMMVHRGSAGVVGTGDDLRTVAEALDRVDAGMAAVYAARTGLPSSQIVDLMARETHMNASEAVSLGFADSVLKNAAGVAPPQLAAAAAAPACKRDFEDGLRAMGFSRSVAARMTAAAWPLARQDGGDGEPELDLTAIADVIARNVAALEPRRTR